MNLIFNLDDINFPLEPFLQYKLIPEIQNYFISSINPQRLEPFDRFINDMSNIQYGLPDNKKRYLSTYDLLITCIYNLVYKKTGEECRIEINSTKNAPNTNAKLLWIAKLVNYGNMQLAPYPIISDLFDHFANTFHNIVNEYKKEQGIE